MNRAVVHPLRRLLRPLKDRLFADRWECRPIKFGIARGMSMLVNRHFNLRYELGLYEVGIAREFARLARRARVAYDIGACFGYYTLALAREGVERIYALEPYPEYRGLLEEAVRRNHLEARVQVLGYWIGATGKDRHSLDALIRDQVILPPDFVKMDIEGEELDALRGMASTIAGVRPSFLIEVHSAELEAQCARLLTEAGYVVRVLDDGSLLSTLLPEGRPRDNRWIAAQHPSGARREPIGWGAGTCR